MLIVANLPTFVYANFALINSMCTPEKIPLKLEPFEFENRILVPSPDVATYDQQPEMNAIKLTDQMVESIESGKYDVIICNYANADMVGHSGNFDAAVKAIETRLSQL